MRIGETTMQCQRKVRHDHRSRTAQFDLFAAASDAAASTPRWDALPEEARRGLTRLMVQLLLSYTDDAHEPKEARDDV
jgi:hypothetical protein